MKNIAKVVTVGVIGLSMASCSSPAKIIRETAKFTIKAVETGGEQSRRGADQEKTLSGEKPQYLAWDEYRLNKAVESEARREQTKRIELNNSVFGAIAARIRGVVQPTEQDK